MDAAKHSKKVREMESEIRSRLVTMGQGNFAKLAGWADSKVSRLNIHDMAVTFVLLEKAWETSLIREVARQAVAAVLPEKKKAPAATEASSQYPMEF